MSLRAILYAYIIGGITFIPLLIVGSVFYALYTSVSAAERHPTDRGKVESCEKADVDTSGRVPVETYDAPRPRKGWLTVRRTFEELPNDTGYVNIMRSFLDARTKDPKRLRPKDMWYVVLKGTVVYLYEDEEMTECEAVIELSAYDVIVHPEGLLDGELFARRNAICLKSKPLPPKYMPNVTREMKLEQDAPEVKLDEGGLNPRRKEKEREKTDTEKKRKGAKEEASNTATPWFIFVRSNTEMEDWYLALVHASEHPAQTPTLEPLEPVFEPADMDHLVATLDEQPDVIPMRWFNALIGRVFFSYYRTHSLETFIIGKLMKKLSKVKRPAFLSDIVVTEVSVGNKAPTFSKPMLKELTKEGDASMEVHAKYKGEVRITVEATATINLSTRLKTYTVKLVLAAILREIEGNMLIKVKRPPSNRIWYAFTQMPRIVLDVEPVVSDRQITWGMILSTIESRLKEIIQESVVLPNMDDIAFFESSPYKRRGGIWADASREKRETRSTFQAPSYSGEAGVQDTSPEPKQNDVHIPTPEAPVPPHSEQQTSEPSDYEDVPVVPPEETFSHPVSSTRRRSWFSSTKIEHRPGRFPDEDEGQTATETERGPVPERADDILTSRSSSRNGDEKISDPDQSVEDGLETQGLLSPRGLRRFSSRHSLHYDHANTGSLDPMKDGPVDRSMTVPQRKLSDAISTTSTSSSPPGASSFLSTLRSKDKQAIRDSAKEAMRKLGVNWGLRKEWISASNNKEAAPDNLPPAKENSSSLVRGSYADVRAAVAERKERATSANAIDTSSTQALGDGLSDALDTAGSDENKDPEAFSTAKPSPSISRAILKPDDLSTEVQQHTPILVQPQRKTMTIPGIHASHKGEIMALGYVAPSDAEMDSKAKSTQTVNSFYRRLMKSPVLPSEELEDVATARSPGDTPKNGAGVPLAPVPMTNLHPHPLPPPLPPRGAPNALATNNPTSKSEPSTTIIPANPAPWDGRVESPAPPPQVEAEGLDLDGRSAPDTQVNDRLPIKPSLTSPPPLPPRRIQTSA